MWLLLSGEGPGDMGVNTLAVAEPDFFLVQWREL